MKYASILETVGKTPVVRLANIAPAHVALYAKVESFNPMGSIKDRFALAVIERAERSGALTPGQTVIEATSGNTGIGLAMVCAQKGYPLVIVMAENFSVERRRLMRFLGAKVILTPAAQKGSGMLAKALELAEAHGWFLTRQFENEVNADVHTETTAREILEDFASERLDYWVSTFGTGGTLKGVARALKAARPDTRIVISEPDNSPMISSGIPQPAGADGVPASHPMFRPHPIQGTSPDFIPKLAADAVANAGIDITMPVNGADALRCARDLATREGIFAGISSGAAVAAALKIAETAPAGSTILCMLPDTGERYLSTPLFESVSAEMNAEEEAIAASTPGTRGAPSPPAVPATPEAAPIAIDAEADTFVTEALSRGEVVMFALEWCEFCWAARRLLQAMGVGYRSVDLDSVAYQADDWGGRIRRALRARTGMATIPQIFVGGELIGGATDLIAAAETGELQARLRGTASATAVRSVVDPRSFLPGWLQRKPAEARG
ncbi:MAG TPA: pyridoxal-phosphate dependent enzyme [Polyangiaceae bacterium]|nr:pyridoxal-phosphate dependent enzyme [Polyangiaceae bacterium]